MRITLTSVFVGNQDKALEFYTGTLSFVKKHDVPVGEFRWITVVSPDDQDGTELLLEPNNNPAAQTYQKEIFKQGLPLASFGVEDIQAEYERLKALGVAFTMEPTKMEGATVAILDDTCGNLIQLLMTRTNHNNMEKSGATNIDPEMCKLRTAYEEWMEKKFVMRECPHEFPGKGKTPTNAKNSSWITIRHPDFPEHVHIRHRLWTYEKETRKNPMGRVDLVTNPANKNEQKHLEEAARNMLGDEVIAETYGKKKQGFQVSFVVPEMRQENTFSEIIAEAVFAAIVRLTKWYFEYHTEQPEK